jgi:hypothetical protein
LPPGSDDSPQGGISDVKALVDLPAPSNLYVVQVRLYYQGIEYGTDRGTLTILDGGLHFQGVRTDFSLELAGTKLISQRPSRDGMETGITLEYRSKVDLTLTFYLLSAWPNHQAGRPLFSHIEELYEALRAWLEEPASSIWREAVGPPLMPQIKTISSHRGAEAMWLIVALPMSLITGLLGLSMLGAFLQEDMGAAGILFIVFLGLASEPTPCGSNSAGKDEKLGFLRICLGLRRAMSDADRPQVIAGGKKNAVWRDLPQGDVSRHGSYLWDVPGPSSQFPVSVRLLHKDVLYGEDQGRLTILDGGLYFQGLRCDFSLTRPDTVVVPPRPGVHLRLGTILDHRSKLKVRIHFEPIVPTASPSPWAAAREFDMMVWQWGASATTAWEEWIGPPLTPQPEPLRDDARATFNLAVVGSLCGLASVGLFISGMGLLQALAIVWSVITFGLWFSWVSEREKLRVLQRMVSGAD